MHTLFVVLNYISVFVMIGCAALVASHESSRMQKLAMMVCTMLSVCCIGFLVKSEAITADTLIVGQKLVYATVTHGMFLMLLFILEYCKFSIPKTVRWICHGINMFITVSVLTLDHHNLFYVKYWAEDMGGYSVLMKEYGPIHTVAVAVFAVYMAAAVFVAIEFSVKNIRQRSRYVWRLLVAISFPCLAYIIPKLTDTNNELQPIAFSLFTLMLIIMVYKSNIYDVNNIATQYSVKSVHHAIIVFGTGYSYKGCNDVALNLFPFLENTSIDKDIRPISQTLQNSLDGKIDEYTVDNTIYSISVRPVHMGESVIGRVLWFEDVTIERNYTKLLQEQKLALESRVETLYDISNKDEMTGLFNRRYYESTISKLRSRKDISDVTVAEIDINGLKNANDSIGHNSGDELIIGTADTLTKVFSKYGNIFRTGGDEFFVIIEDENADIDRMKSELEKEVENWHGELSEKLSVAYGFIRAKDNPQMNIDELMIEADKLMYKNKAEFYAAFGKDRNISKTDKSEPAQNGVI